MLGAGALQQLRHEMDMMREKYERQVEALEQRLAQMERDFQRALQQARQQHQDDVDRLTREKVSVHDTNTLE